MRRMAATAVLLLAAAALLYAALPRPELLAGTPWSAAYLDRDGRLLRLGLAADQRYRLPVGLDRIAPALREATLLYEDRHFHAHGGVDLPALLRAAWQTLAGGERIGASTITMQLARLRYRLPHTLWGKLRQIGRAIQIERHYGKAAILEAYLNLAPYGRNIEGVEAAARIYFDKPAARLSLPEALALSVIPQNPNRRTPDHPAGYREMAAARERLLESWLERHPEQADRRPLFELPLAVRPPQALPFAAPHFVDTLAREERRGEVVTTLDSAAQELVERFARDYLARHRERGLRNLAALLVDTGTMEVRAQLGSADFFDPAIAGQVDGTRARRSPGSALKPLLYGLAMEQGLIHPMSLLRDAPRRFGAYTPENFDQTFLGPLFARDALITSRNVPAVNLAARLPAPGFHGFLQRAGIGGLREAEHYGLALALGGVELTMEELAGLYAMLANGGYQRPLRRLRDEPPGAGRRLLGPEAAWLVLEILRGNPAPATEPLPGALDRNYPIAWKTGTSFAFRDAWAIGLAGPYLLAVWVGDFSGEGNPAYVGRRAAGPLLFEILQALERRHGGFPPPPPPDGLNLRQVEVCAVGGDLPNRYCPRTVASWFIPGVSPIKLSTIHQALPIERAGGRRACRHDPALTRLEVFEHWPSDLLALFRQAGIQRRTPPPPPPECALEGAGGQGEAPQIRSPDAGLAYVLRGTRPEQRTIPFQAVAAGGVGRLYWFVDRRFVGAGEAGETLFWPGEAGEFTVAVVDDRGRGAERRLRVVR